MIFFFLLKVHWKKVVRNFWWHISLRSCVQIPLSTTFFIIFSQNLTEYVTIETKGVCVCVCVSVCLSVCLCVSSLQPKRMDRFWCNFPQMICRIFASDIFHGFWKFKMDDVMAAILYVFKSGTLTVAILLRFSSKLRTRYKVVFQCLLLKISNISR